MLDAFWISSGSPHHCMSHVCRPSSLEHRRSLEGCCLQFLGNSWPCSSTDNVHNWKLTYSPLEYRLGNITTKHEQCHHFDQWSPSIACLGCFWLLLLLGPLLLPSWLLALHAAHMTHQALQARADHNAQAAPTQKLTKWVSMCKKIRLGQFVWIFG